MVISCWRNESDLLETEVPVGPVVKANNICRAGILVIAKAEFFNVLLGLC